MEITTKAIDFTSLALSGLTQRQAAIASNTANAMTPDYQRKEVSFEDQLQRILKQEDVKTNIKELNSINFDKHPELLKYKPQAQELAFLGFDNFEEFKPEVLMDTSISNFENNNNVTIEKEMMDMAKTSMTYQALSTLQAKAFNGLNNIIRGGGST